MTFGSGRNKYTYIPKGDDLDNKRQYYIEIATELMYDKKTKQRINEAMSEYEISNIMTSARHKL